MRAALYPIVVLLLSENHRNGLVGGSHAAWWDFLFYALLGVVVTTTVRIAGVLVVFGFLIIPATISALFYRGVRLAIAWAVAAVTSAAGLILAYYLDFSIGPVIALCMGAILAVTAVLAKLRPILTPRPTRIEGMRMPCSPEEG